MVKESFNIYQKNRAISIKIFMLVFLFMIFSVSFSQTNSNKTINSSEKQVLEDRFKALGDYYIDDSGLVVYRAQPSESGEDSNKIVESKKNTSPNTSTLQQNEESHPLRIKSENTKKVERIVSSPVHPSLEKNVSPPVKQIVPTKNIPVVVRNEYSSQEYEREDDKPAIAKEAGALSAQNIKKSSAEIKDGASGSVLNRKRKSQYKNMEEAALAVENLIDNLKKEQTAYTNSGSMSSRLSRGVTKDLRKKSEQNKVMSAPIVNLGSDSSQNKLNESSDLEPAYFINGVQVDKLEVNKLRKGDIVNREIKVRNTITGNPNGEIWYEVK